MHTWLLYWSYGNFLFSLILVEVLGLPMSPFTPSLNFLLAEAAAGGRKEEEEGGGEGGEGGGEGGEGGGEGGVGEWRPLMASQANSSLTAHGWRSCNSVRCNWTSDTWSSSWTSADQILCIWSKTILLSPELGFGRFWCCAGRAECSLGGSRRQLDESPETRESGGGGCGGLQQLVPHPEATCAMWRQLRRLLSTTLPPSHRQLIGLEWDSGGHLGCGGGAQGGPRQDEVAGGQGEAVLQLRGNQQVVRPLSHRNNTSRSTLSSFVDNCSVHICWVGTRFSWHLRLQLCVRSRSVKAMLACKTIPSQARAKLLILIWSPCQTILIFEN